MLVGGEEGLQSQFGDRDIDRGAENGSALSGAGARRRLSAAAADGEAEVIRSWLARTIRHQCLELVDEGVEPTVRIIKHFLAKPVDHVPGPLVEVDDPRRHALRVQQYARHVDRRDEQLRRHAATSAPKPSLAAMRSPCRSTITAGYGWCPAKMRSKAARTGPSRGSPRCVSG